MIRQEVKLYGAFRSGTNFVKSVLELNYDAWVRTRAGGWKHGPVPAVFEGSGDWAPSAAPILGVVKDPWSWLVSFWRYADGPGKTNVDCAPTWEGFLRSPISVYNGAMPGFPKQWYRTPVDYWITMAVSPGAAGGTTVRYEDMLLSPRETANALADQLGLTRQNSKFVVPTDSSPRGGDAVFKTATDVATGVAFDAAIYTERQFMHAYTANDLAFVTSVLTSAPMSDIGYSAEPS
jgi:hypothetical protein